MRLPTLYSCGICPGGGVSVAGGNDTHQMWNQEVGSVFTMWALPFLTCYQSRSQVGVGWDVSQWRTVQKQVCDRGSACNLHKDMNVSSPNNGLHVNQRRPQRLWKQSLIGSEGVSEWASKEEDGIFHIYPLQWVGKADSSPSGFSIYSMETPLQRTGPWLLIRKVQNPTQRK